MSNPKSGEGSHFNVWFQELACLVIFSGPRTSLSSFSATLDTMRHSYSMGTFMSINKSPSNSYHPW